MLLRTLFLLAGLGLTLPALAEVVSTDPKTVALINQARIAEQEGKVNDALKLYRSAAEADGSASSALSAIAMLFQRASTQTAPDKVATYREQAAAHAQAALKIDARDPVAMEVLRRLADESPIPERRTTPALAKAIAEGEALFHERKYAQALLKYEAAAALDPADPEPVLLIGDCYFMQNDMVHAEEKFRQVVTMDPLSGSGWRFLFDALIKQGKFQDAWAAAVSGVAAMPSAKPSWERVRHMVDLGGDQMRVFAWAPKGSGSYKDKKIVITPDLPGDEHMAWLAYAMSEVYNQDPAHKLSPFGAKLATWEKTAQIIIETGKADKIEDPGLRDIIAFHQAGQLKAAVFALSYKEAYRAEFEAWKKANPDGLKRFIDTFHVGL